MRVYLDSMVFMYEFNRASPYFHDAGLVLRRVIRNHTLLSSLFVRAELLVYPLRDQDVFSIARVANLFMSEAIQVLHFDVRAVNTFALLRGSYGVKAVDALHLAIAANADTDLFVTNDRQLLKLSVAGIGRVVSIEDALGLV